jgi:hypothetical protein
MDTLQIPQSEFENLKSKGFLSFKDIRGVELMVIGSLLLSISTEQFNQDTNKIEPLDTTTINSINNSG